MERQSSFYFVHLQLPAVLVILGAMVLAGCASTTQSPKKVSGPPSSPVAAQPPTPLPAPRPKKIVREDPRDSKEPERLAAVDPKSLIGLQPSAVERLLGSPSKVSNSTPSLVWTYAGQGCSFRVVFYPDIKTESFHALKISASNGEDNSCIRNILTVKSNGPS